MKEKYHYLFGPVPSRRFGRSLGIDPTPYKTCSLDCVFCQLGRTTDNTVIRAEYVPVDAVLAELDEWLKTDGKADYITLSGSGEPTLHSRFGEVLDFIRAHSAIPADVEKIAALAKEIGPDRIQLNTTVRPPAEGFATALPKERMEALTHLFCPAAETIAEFNTNNVSDVQANQETILSMLQRRPCTAEQIADVFGMHLNEVSKYLGKLMRTDQIRTERKNTALYYVGRLF